MTSKASETSSHSIDPDSSNSSNPSNRSETSAWVKELSLKLMAQGLYLSTAESCTGGLIAGACTDLAGSSQWFERGFVSYSNASKVELLGVEASLIAQHGAVSQEVAQAMALGALSHSAAQVSLSVTGVAGPTGGSAEKPVGCVWFAWGFAAGLAPCMTQVMDPQRLSQIPGQGQSLIPGSSPALRQDAGLGANGPSVHSERVVFKGSRQEVRAQTVDHALSRLLALLP
jgi:nicotinamide-nucleotide amidase